jgi:phospholipid/cholesterol/gamma-HCH transport system substrate-binding protein
VKRTGRVPFMKLQVGILVVVTFALLLWGTFQSGSLSLLSREEEIPLRFASVGGLEEGAIVRLNGVPVGHVRDIAFRPQANDVLVSLGVKGGTRDRLHEGAAAHITTVGVMSELYVALDGGDPGAPVLADLTRIKTDVASDPSAIFTRLQSMGDSLTVLMGNLNRMTGAMARGEGTLGRLSTDARLYDQLLDMSRQASRLAVKFDSTQSRLSERFLSLASSLDSLSDRMQHGQGTVAQLMTSGELHSRLTSSTAHADSILSAITSGKGTLGRLYADSTLYDDTRALMASMKRLMAEIEKNPKKYLKFSIF